MDAVSLSSGTKPMDNG